MPRVPRRVLGRAARSATAGLYAVAAVLIAVLANGLATAAVHRSSHVALAAAAAAFAAVACAFWVSSLELRRLSMGRRLCSAALLAAAMLPFAALLGAPAVLIGIAFGLGALRAGSRYPWGALVRPRRRR